MELKKLKKISSKNAYWEKFLTNVFLNFKKGIWVQAKSCNSSTEGTQKFSSLFRKYVDCKCKTKLTKAVN